MYTAHVNPNVKKDNIVTIRDILKAAGVSTATVSNSLNEKGRIGDRARQKVIETAKGLGYIPLKQNI